MKYIKVILTAIFCLLFFSCEKIQNKTNEKNIEKIYNDESFIEQDVYDPFETINRRIYYFNSKFDKYFLLPISNIYSTYIPKPVKKSIHNFFLNLNEVPVFINSTLQLKGDKSVSTLTRFGINSTVGVFGLFDVASKFNIKKSNEDFGQTLGFYGIPAGPYIILPVLGPSSLRDTTGKVINSYTLTYTDPLTSIDYSQRNLEFSALEALDTRSNINFKYYHSGSAFEYDYVRFFYSKVEKLDVKK